MGKNWEVAYWEILPNAGFQRKIKATFRDVYYVSTAKEKSWQQAHRVEERKKETTFTRNIVTQEDYEKTLAKAKERMRGSLS